MNYSYDEPPANTLVTITADVTYISDAGAEVTYVLPPVENGRRIIIYNSSLEHFATDGNIYKIYQNSKMELICIHGAWE